MEVAPNPLTRTYTAPVGQHHSSHSRLHNSSASSFTNLQHQSHTGSTFSAYSDPSASSNSTRDTNSATFPLPSSSASTPPPPTSNGVVPTNNVINKVAEKGTSLFQFSNLLNRRISAAIPGWENELLKSEILARENWEQECRERRQAAIDAGEEPPDYGEWVPLDPVAKLWHTFCRGYVLLWIYNILKPQEPLFVDATKMKEEKAYKAATFKFLQACINKLGFAADDCFILSDLHGNNTTGYIKFANIIFRITELWIDQGIIERIDNDELQAGDPREKRTQRYFIVDELIRTERTYVHHLEVLQSFQNLVISKMVLPGDAIHSIFLNLNALLDFQRRFLIRLEQANDLPWEDQDFGAVFAGHAKAFSVYEPYISNQRNSEETALREFDKLRDLGGPLELQQLVESPATLNAFLLKPFQRLSKYPLLLKDLREKGDLDEARNTSLTNGIIAIQAVLERTNSFIASLERNAAVLDLKARVDDWKGHRVESFGELLLHGEFEVFKLDSSKQVRLYQMYLFEKILVCCKEFAEKQKGVKMSKNTNSVHLSSGRPKLALKGRIFMQNVFETTFLSKPGNYSCRLSWRTEWMSDNIESFVIKFKTEEVMKLWKDTIERQRADNVKLAQRGFNQLNGQAESSPEDGSQTDLVYMQQQGRLENPHKEDTGDDDEASTPPNNESQEMLYSRGSSTSLRSRSNTNEVNHVPVTHLPGPGRGPSTRPPGGQGPPLTLRTQHLPPAQSGMSFFSPVAESPLSSRTSSSSGFASFIPRQNTPQTNLHNDESNRFTAPAHMTRNMIKDQQAGFQHADARTARTSQAPAPPMHPAALAQTRLRSASSPDVQSQNLPVRNAPPVPSVPSHLAEHQYQQHQHHASIRSQNNSPAPFAAQNSNYPETIDTRWEGETISPPISGNYSTLSDPQGPTNFKVKVDVPTEGSSMTLVVGYNISYQSLKDRIDAKLQRHTNLSLASGSVRLQYVYDDELVSIQTDEDVQTAFETWKDAQGDTVVNSQMGEIKLYCNR